MLMMSKIRHENIARWQKNRGVRERGSHEVNTRRTNCDPGCKKYKRENICSETNIQNVQNEIIYSCVTYIYIYILIETKGIIRKKLHCKFW